MDREAVHGIANGWIQLIDRTELNAFFFSIHLLPEKLHMHTYVRINVLIDDRMIDMDIDDRQVNIVINR